MADNAVNATDRDKAAEMQAELVRKATTAAQLRADGMNELADQYQATVDKLTVETLDFIGRIPGLSAGKSLISVVQDILYPVLDKAVRSDGAHLVDAANKANISLSVLTNDKNVLTETIVRHWKVEGKDKVRCINAFIRVSPTKGKSGKPAAPVSAVEPTTVKVEDQAPAPVTA